MPILLIIDLALSGFVTGYMVSASASPVVGVAVPAVISAVVTAVTAFFANPIDAYVQDILKISKKADAKVQTELTELFSRRKALPSFVGIVLIAFFASYGFGLWAGARVRLSHLFGKVEPMPSEIVAAVSKAQTVDEALFKIGYYEVLVSKGLTKTAIADILTKPRAQATPGSEVHPGVTAPEFFKLSPSAPFPTEGLKPGEAFATELTPYLNALGLEGAS